MTKLHINHSLNETLQNHNTCTGSIKTGLFTCTLHVNVKYVSTSIHDFFNRKKNMKIFLLFFFSIKNPHKTILKLAKFKIYVHAVQSHKTCKKVLKRKKNPSLEKEPKLSY